MLITVAGKTEPLPADSIDETCSPTSTMAQRLEQISGHLSNTHSRGLLAGEVAIITGKFRRCRWRSWFMA